MFCPQIFGKNTKKDKNANHFQITRLVKYKKRIIPCIIIIKYLRIPITL